MRRVRYRVAASLDGYIAGPNGETDWIVHDPAIDFSSLYAAFDTVLLGRRTYELTQLPGAPAWPPGWRIYVFSRSLNPAEHPAVTVVSSDSSAITTGLRAERGRDIWLFGGGTLFASLLAADLVDEVEVAVIPVLLGCGLPIAGVDAPPSRLTLTRWATSASGVVTLRYDVQHAAG